MCDCGCGTCGVSQPLMIINENLASKQILSEGLKYHMDNNKPLTEHLYRAGSTNYFNLFSEARSLYSRGILDITNTDDLALLKETNLGHFGVLDGEKVPLDFPIELNELETKEFLKAVEDEFDVETLELMKKAIDSRVELLSKMKDVANPRTQVKGYVNRLNEVKKKSKKKLNKPMRDSSGGKAYKVYVKDPKTGNIKTIRFGSGGLKAKINNKKARDAFSKRHNCPAKTDKTKASYWSCRLPRYAKLLGLKSNFSGFW